MKNKKSISIALRITFYSATSITIAVLIMGLLFTIFLNSQFKDYLHLENSKIRDEIVYNYSVYAKNSTKLDQHWLEQFSNLYMKQGMFISLTDNSGETLWSCLDNNSSSCNMDMVEMNLESLDSLQSSTYKVPTGDIKISYISPEDYSVNDKSFIFETYKMLLLSMVISLIISAISSLLLSRSMSNPLITLSDYATRLASRDYKASDSFKKGTVEIDNLHSAIEYLSKSLKTGEVLRKRLTSDISHDLRTPLTSIQSYLEAMIDGIWPATKERLQDCHDEIIRLAGLVNNLEDLNSYDDKIDKLNLSKVKIKDSIKTALKMFEKEFQASNIQLDVTGEDVTILVDEDRLKRVWINLISNSIKFMKNEGFIKVNIESNTKVEVTFSDNGIGIDKMDIPYIFERFYKVDESRNIEGSGLGLSIVKEIIELHKGDIRVESNKNSLTTFIISLPLGE